MNQASFDPLGRPGAVAVLVDAGQRLEGDSTVCAQVVVLATESKHGGANRPPHVEREDARSGIAAELHGQSGEQNRLAHADGADHQRVAHVADVRDQPERRRAIGAGHDQRRAVKMRIALLTGPHCRHRQHVGQIQGRDNGLAHVGVGVPRNRRQPRIDRVQGFGDRHEAATLNSPLHGAQLFVGGRGIGIKYRHCGGDVTERHLVTAQFLQCCIGIRCLVRGIGIHQRAFLLKDGFA